jgi:uncharacterized protein (TIRG00374 family)
MEHAPEGRAVTAAQSSRSWLSRLPARQIQLAVGILISAVALYVALRGVDWSLAAEAFREANYWLLVPAVLAIGVALLFRAVRWRLLFYPQAGLGLWHFYGVLNVGYMVNNLFPFQVGDLVRVYLLADRENLRKSRVFPTVIIERVVDVLVLFALLMVLVPFISMPGWAVIPVVAVAGVVVVVGVGMVLMAGNRPLVLRRLEMPLRLLPGRWHDNTRAMADAALDGLGVLSRPRVLILSVAWTVAAWLTTALALYFMMLAFGLGEPFSAAVFMVVVTTFGFFIPASPGGLGVYHAIVIQSLVRVFDVPKPEAVSFALVAYLLFYLPPIIIALTFLWREQLSWRRLRDFASSSDKESDEINLSAAAADEAERPL